MREYAVGDEPVPGYQIIRPLGTGGYGTVWVAKSPGDVEIALKIINLQGQGLKEFRAIGIVKRLRHPNLIPIYAYWLKDEFGNFLDSSAQDSVNLRGKSSELIIAMGLGDKSLAQRLEECKSAFAEKHSLPDTEASLIARLQELGGADLAGLPIEELLEYMFGSARAIDYLNQPTHSLGSGPPSAIQHCDIKPGNLLIVSNDVQVCDYGLARVTGDARKTQAAGTPAYMAPELIAGKPSSGTDQYSLAITYYELRTGKLPFEESMAFHAHITGQLDFGLASPAEQAILRRATHTRPDQRFPHSIEVVRALREAITPTRPPTAQSMPAFTPAVAPPSTPSGVYRSGGAPPASASTPTITTKPTVLDDLIRAGVELVPGHKLEQLLGRGGYGEVWAATMPGKTRCALKIVRNLDAVQGKQEFKSLDMIRDLDHDRLIRLQAYWLLAYDGAVIPDDQIGQPGAPKASGLVVATDLAQQNLLQRWQECYEQGQAGIPKEELVPYVHQSAEAIDYLNFLEPAIVHRDIKPENILLTKNRQVKVSDFGLAKLVEGTSAAIGSASVGMTLAYAAPEMFRNQVTRWTDQYSLALTYYRLRVGRLPFEDGMGPIQMMQAHASGTLDFSGVGEAEQAVLRRACAVEPEIRFGSCVEFAETLAAAIGLSGPKIPVPAVAHSHPVSSATVSAGPGLGARWPSETARRPVSASARTARFPAPSDGSSNVRETLRFEDVNAPAVLPPGWPRANQTGSSSDEFHLPDQRRVSPSGLPPGLMETTTSVPSASDVDTAPDGSRQDWRATQPAPRSSGGGKKVVLMAAAAIVLVAGGVGAYLMTRNPGSGGGNSGGDSAAGPTLVERQRKLAAEVDAKVQATAFADAARLVRDTVATQPEKVAWEAWAVEQNATLLPKWKRAASAMEPIQARADEFKQICQAYPSDADAQEQFAKLTKEMEPVAVAVTDEQLTAALNDALVRLKVDDLAGAREKLDAMKTLGASPGNMVMRRAAALRERVDQLASAAKAKPTEEVVVDLAVKYQTWDPQGKPEGEALREACRRALAAKIAAVAPALNDKTDWEKLLAADSLAMPGAPEPTAAWLLACGAECAAELLARKTPPAEDALGGIESALADRKAADPTGGYLTYAQARLAWERRKDRTAAGQLLAVYPATGDVSTALAALHRMAAAARVLEASAIQLRQPDPQVPFKSDDVQPALNALKAADRLSKGALSPVGRLTLALAAWMVGDKNIARQAVEAFGPAETRKTLSTAEALAALRVRAAVQDVATEAGQAAQTDSLMAIIDLHRAHPKEVSLETINRTVIQPLLAEATRPANGAAKATRAKLLADVARLIQSGVRTDPRTWKRLLGSADPWAKVRELYSAAAALDARPEYVVQKIFAGVLERTAKGQGPAAEMFAEAQQVINTYPKYAGGHTLRGELLHLRAVGESDRRKQLADLAAAVKEFREAEKLGVSAAAMSPEDLRWLYQSWSGASLLLGNYTTDRVERDESFRAAVTYAERLKDQDSGYFEGRMALGNAYEDVAYFLGDTDYFPQAIREFEEAKPLAVLTGEARPWLACGRCQYRRAEKAPASSAERRAEAAVWLGLAETDLSTALTKLTESAGPSTPSLTAEAHYFLGLSHALRAEFARAANKVSTAEDESGKADAEYEQAAAVAVSNDAAGRDWGRLVGVARCGLQLRLAQAAIKDRKSRYIKLAKSRAGELRQFSPVAAALWEGSAMDLLERYFPDDTAPAGMAGAAIVKVFETGLQGAGSKDLADQYEINKRLSGWYSGEKLPNGKDWNKAFQALDAAARNARDAGFDADLQAVTLADAAFCRINGLAGLKDEAKQIQYREDLLDRFRRAVETAPAHPFAWFWKLKAVSEGCTPLGVALLKAEPDETPARLVKQARLLEEAARLYREVRATMPLDQEKNFPWVDKERKLVNEQAKLVLDKAIRAAPTDPDVWMWQWALGEIFADAADSNPDASAEARRRLAAAEKAMPAEPPHLPDETRQHYRDRKELLQQYRERIAQLRKDLDKPK